MDYTPTYILTWNPQKFQWKDYKNICKQTQNIGFTVNMDWSCRSKRPKAYDRFVLLMQGMGDKNGIVGYGTFISEPYKYSFNTAFGQNFIDIRIMRLWDYEQEDYLKTKELKEMFPEQCWTPQMSGIRVKSSILPDLWTKLEEF